MRALYFFSVAILLTACTLPMGRNRKTPVSTQNDVATSSSTAAPLQSQALSTLTSEAEFSNPEQFTTPNPSLNDVVTYLQKFVPNDSIEVDPDAAVIYADLNGDKKNDLIVPGYRSVSVLLWNGSSYSAPFIFIEPPGHYDYATKISLNDWTNDSIPEVSFDYRGLTGGTGITHEYWIKNVIHCGVQACVSVWKDIVAALTTMDDVIRQGIDLYINEPVLRQIAGDDPQIVQVSHAFSFLTDRLYLSDYLLELVPNVDCHTFSLCHMQDVFHSVLKLYRWNGENFEKDYETIVGWPHSFPTFVPNGLDTSTEKITEAEVSIVNDVYVFLNKQCQLKIDGMPFGDLFHCYPDYVDVDWIDVTGDGRLEIVIKAVAGPIDIENNYVTEKECTHERLIVYQWDGKQTTAIADITGCVVREDLFGVQLQDVNGDNIPEIVAADKLLIDPVCDQHYVCWEELNYKDQIYKWDGEKFVFWKEAPRTNK